MGYQRARYIMKRATKREAITELEKIQIEMDKRFHTLSVYFAAKDAEIEQRRIRDKEEITYLLQRSHIQEGTQHGRKWFH